MLPSHTPLSNQDVKVELDKNKFALVRNWTSRHDAHPLIAKQIAFARNSASFDLMHRGEKTLGFEQVFEFGVKARPALHEGDLSKLEFERDLVANNPKKFADVLATFLGSPKVTKLGKKHRPSRDGLMCAYNSGSVERRKRMAELFLLAIQLQNYEHSLEPWKELLFLLSCSRSDMIALRYALWFRETDCPPQQAFVFDYAPPTNDSLHEPASTVLKEFEELGLHRAFPNRDKEVFVKMAMLPHYILGYAELRRIDFLEYETEYHPSPHYAVGGRTLEHPPELLPEQVHLMNETKGTLAWLWWNGEENDWTVDPNLQR